MSLAGRVWWEDGVSEQCSDPLKPFVLLLVQVLKEIKWIKDYWNLQMMHWSFRSLSCGLNLSREVQMCPESCFVLSWVFLCVRFCHCDLWDLILWSWDWCCDVFCFFFLSPLTFSVYAVNIKVVWCLAQNHSQHNSHQNVCWNVV